MAPKPIVHVSKKVDGAGWKVTQGGKTLSEHRTQETAAKAGKREAKADKTELAIHGLNGQIREKNSYGNDPNPPKG